MNVSQSTIRWILKPLAFVAGLLPFAWLIWAALTGNLSVNPLSDITHHTGDWTHPLHLHHAGDLAAPAAHGLELR